MSRPGGLIAVVCGSLTFAIARSLSGDWSLVGAIVLTVAVACAVGFTIRAAVRRAFRSSDRIAMPVRPGPELPVARVHKSTT